MKRWRQVFLGIILIILIVIIGANLWLSNEGKMKISKEYNVEINRVCDSVNSQGNLDINLENYNYVKKISMLNMNASTAEIENFYKSSGLEYKICPIIKDESVVFLLKVEYEIDRNQLVAQLMIIVNGCLFIMSVIVIIAMVFIRNSIIKPLNEIKEMPYELSKGHLTKDIKEYKNKFFGRFVWGLNILRENLESNKTNELELEKEKKTLILSISHDIKTPLSAIKLYATALEQNLYPVAEKQHEIAKIIVKNVDKIENFVGEIIKTTKTDFLHIEVKNEEFYLTDLIRQFVIYYSEKMLLKQTDFVIEKYSNCILKGDIEKCLEVMENIMENAIKYGDGEHITILFSQEEDMQLITINNSGNTLPAVEMVHIFESFYRGSNTEGKKGSGLGLYICREIMHKMYGEVYAKKTDNNMEIAMVIPLA